MLQDIYNSTLPTTIPSPLRTWADSYSGRIRILRHGMLKEIGRIIGREIARHTKEKGEPPTKEERLCFARNAATSEGLSPSKFWGLYESVLGVKGLADRYYEVGCKFEDGANEKWRKVNFGVMFEPFPYHFLHVSVTDRTQVAYYQSIEHLLAGRETRVKPGRYLTKHYPHITPCEVKRMVEYFNRENAPVTVQFARTRDEIIRAIAEGPSDSCMANGNYSNNRKDYSHWDGHIHPAAIYAKSGDIEVAYVENDEGEVKSRVICNAKTKKMARIYGDSDSRMLQAMQLLGYVQERGALVGCRLEKLENGNGEGWIMPYVDAGTGQGGGALDVRDAGEWWVLCNGGEFNTHDGYEGNGVAQGESEPEMECDECGDGMDEDDSTYIEHYSINVCEHCLRSSFTEAYANGSRYRDHYRYEDVVECLTNGHYYLAETAAEHDVYQCESSCDWYKLEDLVNTSCGLVCTDFAQRLDVDDSEGNSYACKGDAVQTHDGRWIHKDDAVEADDGRVMHVNDDEKEQSLQAEPCPHTLPLAL